MSEALSSTLRASAPWSAVLLAVMVVALLGSVAAVLLSLRARWSGGLLPVLAVPLVALALLVATTAHGIHRGRALVFDAVAATDPTAKATGMGEGTTLQTTLAGLGGELLSLATLWVTIAAVIVVVRAARRRQRSPWPTLWPVAAAVLLLLGVSVVTMFWGLHVMDTFVGLTNLDPAEKSPVAEAGVRAAAAMARGGQLAIVGAALLLGLPWVAAAVRAARSGVVVGWGLWVAALLVAGAGGALLVATRAHAWDAAHVLPAIDSFGLVSGRTLPRLPRVDRCTRWLVQAPVIQHDGVIELDGHRVDGAEELRDLLITLRNNYRLLHPDEEWPEDAPVILMTPRDALARLQKPIFEGARAAGFGSIDAVMIVDHDIDTRTLGHLERMSQCAHRFSLDQPFAPPPDVRWAQFLGAR